MLWQLILILIQILLQKILREGSFKTKKTAVNFALENLYQRIQQEKVIDLFGTIDFDPDYDYKALRKQR